MLKYLLGHSRVRLTPVIHPDADIATDAYEIPDPIRSQVLARDTVEVFPFSPGRPGQPISTTPSPTVAAGNAKPGQRTSPPLSRKPHRAKTHAGWHLEQPTPDIFWWQTPTGQRYRVGPNGTIRIGRNPRNTPFEQALWNSDHELGPPVQGVG